MPTVAGLYYGFLHPGARDHPPWVPVKKGTVRVERLVGRVGQNKPLLRMMLAVACGATVRSKERRRVLVLSSMVKQTLSLSSARQLRRGE